ncbi:SIR2 family protein [Vibrio fluvialis]|uniref:SIR2 family protein n=1 Tax=Vibrio fluvialis TaxID=676 RepID=UPI002ACA1EB9|nr:SIR2 family protein [Vibrio fluvialis]MDZ5516663.1 SIR2 family protein [Vibrio fluvialis]
MNSTNTAGDRPKSWLQFLETAVSLLTDKNDITVSKKLIRQKDLLTACEVIKGSLGTDEFVDLVEKEFLTPAFRAADIHTEIFKLDSRIVLTPNFDKIYETYVIKVSEGTVKVKNYYDDDIAKVIRGRRTDRTIIKIHGTVDQPEKLIFSRNDYVSARSNNRDFYSILDSLIMTHTFIFLGCGIDDPDIKLLLEDYANKFRFSRNHFFITRKKTIDKQVKKVIEDTMKLKILEYSGSGNDHSKLHLSIQNLVDEVDKTRISLSKDADW